MSPLYAKLTAALLHTREDFASVCKLMGVDPEFADPAMLDAIMCDNCSYWETPELAHVTDDDTVLCRACHMLEDLRF